MGNEKSLGEKVGDILQRIADKEELLSYLHRQPLSREWEQEDILNCKPEYMAVLTENERELLLCCKESSLEAEYNQAHPQKEQARPMNTTGCLIMVITVLFVAFYIKSTMIGSILIVTNLIISLIQHHALRLHAHG